MAAMVKTKCAHCAADMEVREADLKRGWGKFCSKSCKAKDQERRKGQLKQTGACRAGKRRNSRRKHDPKVDGIWRHGKRVECRVCGDPAVNGVVSSFLASTPVDPVHGVPIEWYCALHHCDTHPFSDDAFA